MFHVATKSIGPEPDFCKGSQYTKIRSPGKAALDLIMRYSATTSCSDLHNF